MAWSKQRQVTGYSCILAGFNLPPPPPPPPDSGLLLPADLGPLAGRRRRRGGPPQFLERFPDDWRRHPSLPSPASAPLRLRLLQNLSNAKAPTCDGYAPVRHEQFPKCRWAVWGSNTAAQMGSRPEQSSPWGRITRTLSPQNGDFRQTGWGEDANPSIAEKNWSRYLPLRT